ncbi:RNA-binding cell elongation regulator Jag/EloR [Virgibacillus sp. 179-BFC.A HS]|uniref:RNA-binding protein KhpB n=1 Tax=Tigheibacillus jepli TaxID=3035914 RepID=A0ABU5CEZ2_9BACI|nr:RNA-binding cell elongation regulator Jag/EloR [Virgibacillus sp. 179-BFC.A HS]MDY0404123.1 RNA-binding cell elongation regulator Jag/EloR [Virgibacillus sp. 179-BFC.A HS]
MKQITASGQSVEEAVQAALEQLNASRDQVEIEVIDEGKKGLLGVFGSKRSIVKISLVKDPIEEAQRFIEDVTGKMGIDVQVATQVNDRHVTFDLQGDKIALLIGKRGQTLNALQYLVQLFMNKNKKHYYTVMLDAQGYRQRRKETLEVLAARMAEKSVRNKTKVALEPMPAFERKIIHMALQNDDRVTTYSDSIDPHRHIVIEAK